MSFFRLLDAWGVRTDTTCVSGRMVNSDRTRKERMMFDKAVDERSGSWAVITTGCICLVPRLARRSFRRVPASSHGPSAPSTTAPGGQLSHDTTGKQDETLFGITRVRSEVSLTHFHFLLMLKKTALMTNQFPSFQHPDGLSSVYQTTNLLLDQILHPSNSDDYNHV